MPQKLKIASAQSRTLSTTPETVRALERTTKSAAEQGIDIILFPEAYLGGYPRSCTFGNAVGGRTEEGRNQFLHYFHDAVDLGDTPRGAGDDWVERKLPLPKDRKHRGDGTREELERIARETGVFIVTGLVERAGGTLYCGVVYVCPRYGIIGKRRKVMPTGSERTIWGQGSPSTLRAVTTEIKGVRLCMAAAICWENYMPLLRQALYSQNVNLWFAPTADARDAWASLMRTVGIEGRCFVVSANQCVRRKHLPAWVTCQKNEPESHAHHEQLSQQHTGVERQSQHVTVRRRKSTIVVTEGDNEICLPCLKDGPNAGQPNGDSAIHDDEVSPSATPPKSFKPQSALLSQLSIPAGEEFVCRGGSCIISPMGEVLAGPLWEVEDGGLLVTEVDFEDCERGRLDLDVAGSYSRMDSFHLTVDGLDLDPPP
ncbi:carbon-nitrogen hydrolase [Westerdykella ornata]|uniref:Carbon-nitrogen hydrolase n=1 Tax=Westerdykella ornata TaxID=318751 RepID=A0A6A6JJH2_WESOR|nr:carbon-nitrogen hydrolase [Westerdykella ornata]KAF2276790.1 carbon-nitrogen hydrolase [Westerdykella ornata]